MSSYTKESLVQLFLELVKIDAPSQCEKPVADYIRAKLAGLPIEIVEDDAGAKVGCNSGNIICRVGNGGDMALMAHMDSARPTKNLVPQVLEDRITSDGTTILAADDRAGIAVILTALEMAAKAPEQYKDFTAIFTVFEEGGLNGAKHLRIDDNLKMAFAFDSSDLPGGFINETFGAQRFEVRIVGRAAHSGVSPEKGIHAIKAAANALANIPMGKIHEELRVNIGTMTGGTAVNVVPAEAKLAGEVRGTDIAEVEAQVRFMENEFRKAADELGATLEFESGWDFEPYHIDNGAECHERISAAIRKVGLEPNGFTTAGGSDANVLNARGVPAINVGTGAQNVHADDEYIMIDDLVKTQEIALALLKR